MNDKEYDYTKIHQGKMRDENIIKSSEESFENNVKCKYSEEQVLVARDGKAKKDGNELYYENIFPLMNSIIYMVYYIASIIILPLIYFRGSKSEIIIAIIAFFLLVFVYVVIWCIDRCVNTKKWKTKKWMQYLEQFSNNTSTFTYLMTSIGYMTAYLNTCLFIFFYIIMILIFVIAVWNVVLKQLLIDYKFQRDIV